MNIGLESGNERVRREILKRDYTNEEVLRVMELAQKTLRFITLYIMMGLPTETRKEFLDTIELTRKCRPNFLLLSIFCPYPGTDLFKYCVQHQLLPAGFKDRGKMTAVLDLPEFSKKEIQREYYYFLPNVYINNRSKRWIAKVMLYLANEWKFLFLLPIAMKMVWKDQALDLNKLKAKEEVKSNIPIGKQIGA